MKTELLKQADDYAFCQQMLECRRYGLEESCFSMGRELGDRQSIERWRGEIQVLLDAPFHPKLLAIYASENMSSDSE